jgi:glutamate-ammonia-ligase adenylyltransferase
VAERLARLLATSRYATDLLEREPEGVRMLGHDLTPLGSEVIVERMRASADRQEDPAEAVRSVRAIRRRELFRIAVGELFGETDVATVGEPCVSPMRRSSDALEVAGRAVRPSRAWRRRPRWRSCDGRYGGFEPSRQRRGRDVRPRSIDEADGEEATARPRRGQRCVGCCSRRHRPALVVDADLPRR